MEENILVRHGMDYFLANRKSFLNIFLKYLGMLTPPSTMWSQYQAFQGNIGIYSRFPNVCTILIKSIFQLSSQSLFCQRLYIFKGPNNVIGLYWRLKFEQEQFCVEITQPSDFVMIFLGTLQSSMALVYVLFSNLFSLSIFKPCHNQQRCTNVNVNASFTHERGSLLAHIFPQVLVHERE